MYRLRVEGRCVLVNVKLLTGHACMVYVGCYCSWDCVGVGVVSSDDDRARCILAGFVEGGRVC